MTIWDSLFLILGIASVGTLLPLIAVMFAWHGCETPRVIGEGAIDMLTAVGQALSRTLGLRRWG